jgi:hypothetical protein
MPKKPIEEWYCNKKRNVHSFVHEFMELPEDTLVSPCDIIRSIYIFAKENLEETKVNVHLFFIFGKLDVFFQNIFRI